MKTLTYSACTHYESGDVIVCVDPNLTASGAPFVDGVLSAFGANCAECDPNRKHCYQIMYDENQLLDPTSSLGQCDVSGLVCRSCLTDYIDWLFGQASIPVVT